MARDLTIGRYYDRDSVIHRLDARVKLIGVFVFLAILFINDSLWWYAFSGLMVLGLYRLADLPAAKLLSSLKAVWLLLFFTFIFRLFMTPGAPLYTVGTFAISNEGLYTALRMTARIALMIAMASLLSYATGPKDLGDGLVHLLGFLAKFKVPMQDMSIMIMIAFHFIPILLDEVGIIRDAQASRGADFKAAGIIGRTKSVLRLVQPLFMSVIKKSTDLAIAIESRGYSSQVTRTRLHPLVYRRADHYAFMLIAGYVVMFVVFYILK